MKVIQDALYGRIERIHGILRVYRDNDPYYWFGHKNAATGIVGT